MNIHIINGPNLDRLGTREPEIYGTMGFPVFLDQLKVEFTGHVLGYFQSNVEGELIDALRRAEEADDAVVLNAAGYSHTSVALRDTLASMAIPVIEVHISNIHGREEFRQTSLTAGKCMGCITGFGLDGYRMAIDHFLRHGR